ncbi:MAG TPA: nucleotidyltransferase family protein, partial [Beijerinckiaceae bacterium]|nr:nucleotidyltransferase family protein [Beijerinckiaceae bacterium]
MPDGGASPPSGSIDWGEVLRLARRHRVQSLVARGLERLGIEAPAGIRQDARRIVEDNLRAADECARLADRFAAGGIDLLFVKGLSLSKLAYGDPFIKMSADIDLLVEAAELVGAAALLEELGYRRQVPTRSPLATWHRLHKESLWRRPRHLVELHHRLSDNPALLDGVGMGSARQQVEIFPGSKLATLARDPLVIYVAIHGASSGYFRLKWLADFAALLSGADDAEVDRLQCTANACGAGHAFAASVALAAEIFGTPAGVRTAEIAALPYNRRFQPLARRALRNPAEPTDR